MMIMMMMIEGAIAVVRLCMYFFLLLHILPYNEYYKDNITSWICQRKEKENIGVFFFGWSKVLLLMLCSCRVARQALRQTAHDRTEPNQKQRKEELL